MQRTLGLIRYFVVKQLVTRLGNKAFDGVQVVVGFLSEDFQQSAVVVIFFKSSFFFGLRLN